MNCDLVGLLESKWFKNDNKLNGLIMLNGRNLTAEEIRKVVRAAVKNGYTELYDVPDSFAESVLENS